MTETPTADFRSSSGIYAQINESNNYELDDPQQMFVACLENNGAYNNIIITISTGLI